MKKKIFVYILLVIVFAVTPISLAACSQPKISYVNSSFEVIDINYWDSLMEITAIYKFSVKSELNCSFDMEYVIAVKNASTGETVITKTFNDYGVSIKKNETKLFAPYPSLEITENDCSTNTLNSLMNNTKIELQNISFKFNSDGISNQYDGYALGFGIASAILLTALIAMFVIAKLKD